MKINLFLVMKRRAAVIFFRKIVKFSLKLKVYILLKISFFLGRDLQKSRDVLKKIFTQ